jgi:hypothetical protein
MEENKKNAFRLHTANFITGMRNCKYLVDQCNFQYVFNKEGVNGAKFYVCTKKRDGCRGKATVREGMIVGLYPHNDHESNPIKIDVMKKASAMMEAIQANPNIKTGTLVTNFLKTTLKPEYQSAVGSKKALERRIQRAKASLLQRPPVPNGGLAQWSRTNVKND